MNSGEDTSSESCEKVDVTAPRKTGDHRRLGREFAMQFLFQADLSGEKPEHESLACFWEQTRESSCFPLNKTYRRASEFAEKIISGTYDHITEINETIASHSRHYTLDRMGAVDRNLIRMAVYEMMFMLEIPPIVSINEAVEIAKGFGGEESASFVNGILNSVKNSLNRSAREAVKSK